MNIANIDYFSSTNLPLWLIPHANNDRLMRIFVFLEHYIISNSTQSDCVHDVLHGNRVAHNAFKIAENYDVNYVVLLVSCYLHDVVSYEKGLNNSNQSSIESATHVRSVSELVGLNSYEELAIIECIMSHSYSAGHAQETIESKILFDADKLDALGAIGIARLFSVSGSIGSKLYNRDEPFSVCRELDDRHFAIDHFYKKIFLLPERLNTPEAKAVAEKRIAFMREYMDVLSHELI